jgi:hypothetical protein
MVLMDTVQVPAGGGGGGAGGAAPAAAGSAAPAAEKKEEEKPEEKVCVRLCTPDDSCIERIALVGRVRRGYGLRFVRLEMYDWCSTSIRATYFLFCDPIGP